MAVDAIRTGMGLRVLRTSGLLQQRGTEAADHFPDKLSFEPTSRSLCHRRTCHRTSIVFTADNRVVDLPPFSLAARWLVLAVSQVWLATWQASCVRHPTLRQDFVQEGRVEVRVCHRVWCCLMLTVYPACMCPHRA